jgi:hypothetical protein
VRTKAAERRNDDDFMKRGTNASGKTETQS